MAARKPRELGRGRVARGARSRRRRAADKLLRQEEEERRRSWGGIQRLLGACGGVVVACDCLDRLPDYGSDGSWPGGSCLPLELAVVERQLGLACDGVVADG